MITSVSDIVLIQLKNVTLKSNRGTVTSIFQVANEVHGAKDINSLIDNRLFEANKLYQLGLKEFLQKKKRDLNMEIEM